MKKLFMSLIVAGVSLSTFAQEESPEKQAPTVQKVELPMMCTSASNAEKLIQQQKEAAVFAGLDKAHGVENLTMNVFRNENTGTFTVVFIKTDKDLVCILSAGEKSNFLYRY